MKDYEKVIKLKSLYSKMNVSSRKSNDFSYVEKMILFKQGLKEVLYSNFENEVIFDSDDSINYISGEYKGISFSINTYDGIRLTIDNIVYENDILEAFYSIICTIAGYPICKYDVSSIDDDDKCLVYEWSFNPISRLGEIKGESLNFSGRIENLEDFYTTDLIRHLGDNLLTFDGFITIFNGLMDDDRSMNDIIRLIDEVRPEIGYSNIIKWINDSKRQLSMKRGIKGSKE